MYRNYFKVALRNILRNKTFSVINISGLAIGITCCILILLYIQNELSFDRFHDKADNIYRVGMEMIGPEGSDRGSQTTAAVGPTMVNDFPEILETVRFNSINGYLNFKDKNYFVQDILYTDSTIFKVFSFELIIGNPGKALSDPYSIVLTEETAEKIFGKENPVGKFIRLNNKEDLTITGIVKSPPENSHIQFNSLISFSSLYEDSRLRMDWNGGWRYYTYIELMDGFPVKELEEKIPDFMYKYINKKYEQLGYSLHPIFEPLKRIYLYSDLGAGPGPSGSLSNIYIFSAIAFFILMIACINFMNLTTAQSAGRAREVGIRKVIGAGRKQLIRQFLGESVLLSFIGLIIALILIEIVIPGYNNLIGRKISLYGISAWWLIFGIPLFILIVGVLAGSYPSFYLSSFQPLKVIKGIFTSGSGKSGLRNTLVIFQFIISIVLIICTGTIYNQLNYIRNKEPGFDKENIVILPLVSDETRGNNEIIKTAFKSIPDIIEVSASSDYPGHGFTRNGYLPEGFEEPIMIHVVDVDYDFIKTVGLEILKGRSFSREFSSDPKAYLINETCAKHLGWGEPIAKIISRGGDHQVIGLVKDFHFASLYHKIEPLIFTMKPYMGYSYLSVRINSGNINTTLNQLKKQWEKVVPGEAFDYIFLDESFNRVYRAEQQFGKILLYFAILTIIIACLGLFGLASFSTERRTKEIGIRKVMGSSVSGVVILLSREFTRWVLIANIVAWPVAYYGIKKWLQNFEYRIDFPVWIFFATALLVFLIAIFTVSYQAVKAARANPVDALKYE